MKIKRKTLSTIGYESADMSDFLATLKAASVTCVIDVRQLAMSRRKGFSKTALSTALRGAGISYVHLRNLGDPKAGREAARIGDYTLFRKIFSTQMASMAAQTDLTEASRFVADGGACLMCFERDHTRCHRSIVAQAISGIVPVEIQNLGVRTGLGIRSHNAVAEFA